METKENDTRKRKPDDLSPTTAKRARSGEESRPIVVVRRTPPAQNKEIVAVPDDDVPRQEEDKKDDVPEEVNVGGLRRPEKDAVWWMLLKKGNLVEFVRSIKPLKVAKVQVVCPQKKSSAISDVRGLKVVDVDDSEKVFLQSQCCGRIQVADDASPEALTFLIDPAMWSQCAEAIPKAYSVFVYLRQSEPDRVQFSVLDDDASVDLNETQSIPMLKLEQKPTIAWPLRPTDYKFHLCLKTKSLRDQFPFAEKVKHDDNMFVEFRLERNDALAMRWFTLEFATKEGSKMKSFSSVQEHNQELDGVHNVYRDFEEDAVYFQDEVDQSVGNYSTQRAALRLEYKARFHLDKVQRFFKDAPRDTVVMHFDPSKTAIFFSRHGESPSYMVHSIKSIAI